MLQYFYCPALVAISLVHEPFNVQFQWNYLNYTWPSYDAYSSATSNQSYIDSNNIISSIKIWKDRIYLAVPRYRKGVSVTLAVTSATVIDGDAAPLLEPYPNWDMQEMDNCSALQNVNNMEIDPKGRMWVLDSGRLETMTSAPHNHCPPKLMIFDSENNGTVLRNYVFPENVVNYNSSVLQDLVVDHEHGGMVYITDSDENNPGIIAYSVTNNTSWKIYHECMDYVLDAVAFNIHGIPFLDKVNIHGIALSPASTEGKNRRLFFSALSSFNVFSVNTEALIDAQYYEQGEEREKEIHKHIKILGRKPSQTDGMVMSNTGKLYFGLLYDDAVSMWDSKKCSSFVTGQRYIAEDHNLIQWPSSFAIDDKGQLWILSNRMYAYRNNSLDVKNPNYRVHVSKVNMHNYQYYENGTAPYWPKIISA